MDILVRGNVKFYQDTIEPKGMEIEEFSLKWNSRVFYEHKDFRVEFESPNKVFLFSRDIRGKNIESIPYLFQKYLEINNIQLTDLEKSTYQKKGMIKALFTIFPWIEFELSSNSEDVGKWIYDQFTIDYTGKHGKQKDIYFLPKKFTQANFQKHINVLIKLNLLCEFILREREEDKFRTYFIPLIKPGVKDEFFFEEGDEYTIKVWQSILDFRNKRLRNFMKP